MFERPPVLGRVREAGLALSLTSEFAPARLEASVGTGPAEWLARRGMSLVGALCGRGIACQKPSTSSERVGVTRDGTPTRCRLHGRVIVV
ncbi:MAG TPA: hypothetical protein VKP30_03260 [Polyangiaceae bacterium]|nr:hypothetical protein [Polyangiaceae bacterium]